MSRSRLFFALWPDEETRERLYAVSRALPDDCGRRVARDNLHLTLAFLGGVDRALIPGLIEGAGGIRVRTFSLSLERLGWFKRARVIWLAPKSVPEPLLRLVAGVNGVIRRSRLRVDERPYDPHLTLVRKAARPLQELQFDPICWNISDFCLVESNTRPAGVEYKIIESWPLS